MTFINTDGMSFIGPGSEWFWTALSGIVLAVTFLAIYRQLRLQRSQTSIEQLERIPARVASRTHPARQGGRPCGAPRRRGLGIGPEPTGRDDRDVLGTGRVPGPGRPSRRQAALQRRRGRPERVLVEAARTVDWHAAGRPRGSGWTYENFEWVARTMAALDRGAGHPAFDDATNMDVVPDILALNQDRLAVAVALRTVTVALPEAAPAPTAAAAQD